MSSCFSVSMFTFLRSNTNYELLAFLDSRGQLWFPVLFIDTLDASSKPRQQSA